MSRVPERVVVVGAGQAGASLVAALRDKGHEGPITLLGDEPDPPYQRPPLSKKYLLGEMSAERLALRSPSFYEEERIRLVQGQTVTGIDRVARLVFLGEESVPYDALALTLGAEPRILPPAMGGELSGVHVIRSRSHVDTLAPELETASRALVIGGGYIGLEAAAVLAARGIKTVLIELAERIVMRVASAETAGALKALHAAHGVTIREATGLERLEGDADGKLVAAWLSDGTRLPVDLAIVGIGVAPRTALAEGAGLAIENGIATDAKCRTSDPAVYAAGDCASFPYKGRRIRLESVQNAIDQASHAAAVMMGETAPYVPYPWFWSDQFDARLQIAGLNTGYDRVIERAGTRPGARSFWYFAGDEFLAVDALSDPKAYMTGKRWLEQGKRPSAACIADPAMALADCA